MLWHAMPPELNTARLMAGEGAAPAIQAASGWEALSIAQETQADELAASLALLGQAWTGTASERALAATTPMVVWLRTAATSAHTRALQATAQAAAYTRALAMTPSLLEIATNHITHAVLTATNFLGINTVPIGVNEADYFIRMWNQAASAMDVYQADTAANTVFEKVGPMEAILGPETGQAAASAAGRLAATASNASALPAGELTLQQSPAMSGALLNLLRPLQQVTSLFSQIGGASGPPGASPGTEHGAQLGLLGAGALSNHPLTGGSGPRIGAGLLRADSLPGSGGSSARTPLMAQLIGQHHQPPAPASPTGAGPGSSTAGGVAPMGNLGRSAQSGGGSKPGLAAPEPLSPAQDDYDAVDSEDGDDW
ncbi:PPE family protein [Mycobacterium spongiae]|uniref:PPE domain-containing protein n=1 Tax=Mycobacterium spongiae TaxID=886343 RepID=A0A975JXL7_9MYCO|nr:PPE family protein [Mycobacterium spongiae]QUR66518.1 PPE domain-containing protein [Mycobacterium spongiae]